MLNLGAELRFITNAKLVGSFQALDASIARDKFQNQGMTSRIAEGSGVDEFQFTASVASARKAQNEGRLTFCSGRDGVKFLGDDG